MKALIAALCALLLTLFLHGITWRIAKPKGEYRGLLALCAIVFSVFLFLSTVAHISISPDSFDDWFSFALLFMATMAAYIVTYSAVQADSPSMRIVLKIDASEGRGLSRHELEKELNDEVLIAPRLHDLLVGKLATLEAERYVITTRGAILAKMHIFYRDLLKMEKGG